MPTIHFLTKIRDFDPRTNFNAQYLCAVHLAMPTGSNAAGFLWSAILLDAGFGGKTVLATGNGPGQIAASELAQINTGALIEVPDVIVEVDLSGAIIGALPVDQALAALAGIQAKLDQYGRTVP